MQGWHLCARLAFSPERIAAELVIYNRKRFTQRVVDRQSYLGLPDCKPVSVLSVAEEWPPFLLAGDLSPAPATYPEVVTERTAPAPLFGLAPRVQRFVYSNSINSSVDMFASLRMPRSRGSLMVFPE